MQLKKNLKAGFDYVSSRRGWTKAGWGGGVLLAFFVMFLYRPDLPPPEVEARWKLPDSRFLTLPDGLRVHYRHLKATKESATKRPPLLFVHGSGSSLHSWTQWASRLHEYGDVWLVDLPGAGLTGPSPARQFGYTIPDYAEFLLSFMNESAMKKAIVAGHSVGGEVAWYFAGAHPKKVAGLILVAPTGYPATPPLTWQIGKMPVLGWLLAKATPEWIVGMNLREAFAQDERITRRLIRRYQELVRREGNREALRQQMRAARLQYWPRLQKLEVPTLLLWGRKDVWLPVRLAQRFVKDVPHVHLKIYENAGHALPEEKSRAVEDICRWMSNSEDFVNPEKYFQENETKC